MARQVQATRMGVKKRTTSRKYKPYSKTRKYITPQIASAQVARLRRNDFGFPDKFITRLKYADVLQLTGAATIIGSNWFRALSLFDPDSTGLGHQPMFFDQLCGAPGNAPYRKYRVLKSYIKVTFSQVSPPSVGATQYAPTLVGIQPSTTASFLNNTVSSLLENDAVNTAILGDKSGGNNVVTLYNSYNPIRDLGTDLGDDTISAEHNANPSSNFYFGVFKVDPSGTDNATIIQATVEIVFTAEFYARNEVTQS